MGGRGDRINREETHGWPPSPTVSGLLVKEGQMEGWTLVEEVGWFMLWEAAYVPRSCCFFQTERSDDRGKTPEHALDFPPGTAHLCHSVQWGGPAEQVAGVLRAAPL